MSDQINFEYPLHERSRTLLRLSHSFMQFDYHLAMQGAWETRAAMSSLLEIAQILGRADIKSDLIKEMERQSVVLGKMRQTQGVDSERLEAILSQLGRNISDLHKTGGQLGKLLRDHEFLKSIQQRSSIPGGNCDFDLPLYHYWLELPHEQTTRQMSDWMETLTPLRKAVDLLLMLMRGSSMPVSQRAEKGFYQKTLDGNTTVLMIKIVLPRSSQLYPEVSGGKHRFNIRFLQTHPLEHPQQTDKNVEFDLTTCII